MMELLDMQMTLAVSVYNSSFYSNRVSNDGGVLYAYDSSHITLYNNFFESNIAKDDSGVLYAYDGSTLFMKTVPLYINNQASEEARVAYTQESSSITVTKYIAISKTILLICQQYSRK